MIKKNTKKYVTYRLFIKSLLCLLSFLVSSIFTYAKKAPFDQQINITAEKLQHDPDVYFGSIDTVSPLLLKEKPISNIGQILTQIPGLYVSGSEANNNLTSLFLRGESSGRVIIMVDGIKLNDPSSPDRGFDLSLISSDNIERIEILKGTHNSIGGLINIITKGRKKKDMVMVSFVGNSRRGITTKLNSFVNKKSFWYSTSFSHQQENGPSLVKRESANSERDSFNNSNIALQGGFDISNTDELELIFRASQKHTDTDQTYPLKDDPNYWLKNKKLVAKVKTTSFILDEQVELQSSIKYLKNIRLVENKAESQDNFKEISSEYMGSNIEGEIITNFSWTKHKSSFGVSVQKESLEIKDKVLTTGNLDYKSNLSLYVFNQNYFKIKKYILKTNLRYNQQNLGENFSTFNVAIDIPIAKKTILKSSYGNGVNSPSLYQLYSIYGNQGLRTEKASSFDIEIIKKLTNNEQIKLSYFINHAKDKIDFNPSTEKYENIKRTKIKGLEFHLIKKINNNINIAFSLTKQKTQNLETKKSLPMQPDLFGSTHLNWQINPKLSINSEIRYISKRESLEKKLSAYNLVNLYGSYSPNKHYKIYTSINNALNEDYTETGSFKSPKRWFLLGVSWKS